MILEYIYGDNSKKCIDINYDIKITSEYKYVKASNKLEYIESFLPAFIHGQKMVLFDSNHKQLVDFYEHKDINTYENIETIESQLLFFTSGSSGFPVGAFKSRDNILQEIEVLKNILSKRSIKKVIVTVPFVHIYGILVGLLLPFYLDDVTLVVKEDFLPYELLEELSNGECLVITTPVFIKALGKLDEQRDLSSSMFISSTGPLQSADIQIVESKYNTSLMQLFGSTETGGIAYKFSDTTRWIALDGVKLEEESERLRVSSAFISEYILNEEIVKINQPFATEDIIQRTVDGFKLLGRSNKIIKIAGKRISAMAIESIIESIPEVKKAIVTLVYKKELLRSEQILIQLESDKTIEKKLIKQKIKECYGVLSIPFKIEYVEKINFSSMGKKIIF